MKNLFRTFQVILAVTVGFQLAGCALSPEQTLKKVKAINIATDNVMNGCASKTNPTEQVGGKIAIVGPEERLRQMELQTITHTGPLQEEILDAFVYNVMADVRFVKNILSRNNIFDSVDYYTEKQIQKIKKNNFDYLLIGKPRYFKSNTVLSVEWEMEHIATNIKKNFKSPLEKIFQHKAKNIEDASSICARLVSPWTNELIKQALNMKSSSATKVKAASQPNSANTNGGTTEDIDRKLKKLKSLIEKGLITKEEAAAKRKAILDAM